MTWNRKQTLCDVIALIASKGGLKLENAPAIAKTYGVPVTLVESEMLKYPTEECGK